MTAEWPCPTDTAETGLEIPELSAMRGNTGAVVGAHGRRLTQSGGFSVEGGEWGEESLLTLCMGGEGTLKVGAAQPRQSSWGCTSDGPWKKDSIPAMELHEIQSSLLMSLLLLVIRAQSGAGLESIHYVPQLYNATLLGRLTQSTFALEQPLGQFENVNLSDPDPIWLVVAHSNSTQNFAAPQKVEDNHAPAGFDRNGYYLTLRASRVHYQGRQVSSQLRVLRVGNDTNCSLEFQGCNSPLPGSGPYRVKFLAMSPKGPVAETQWSEEIYLQQAQTFPGDPGFRSKGTVFIIAFLSILLAVFLVLVISACCWRTPVFGPEEQVRMKRYHTHHMDQLSSVERSS
ncbi:uroplakin-3b-like protein 1 [Cricetulus griseus]|uniref:Uroplakin-3b-like protein 1 n=1 Tax=Cricetulus griseus TaxID=10029 RepID=A0A9J7G3T8_CRIGR|nr:uroplakin-3b-like protein 1 [Cricetulus griseus]